MMLFGGRRGSRLPGSLTTRASQAPVSRTQPSERRVKCRSNLARDPQSCKALDATKLNGLDAGCSRSTDGAVIDYLRFDPGHFTGNGFSTKHKPPH